MVSFSASARMSMLAAGLAKMREQRNSGLSRGCLLDHGLNPVRSGSMTERPPPPFFPPPFGRRQEAVLRPFDGQFERRLNDPQTPFNDLHDKNVVTSGWLWETVCLEAPLKVLFRLVRLGPSFCFVPRGVC
jgi:hypothetical protein